MNDKMFTATEVAEILRVSRATLSRLTARGEIVGRRIGGKTMYFEADLKAYLDRSRTA